MLKADAYGHGAIAVAHSLKDVADGFGVATLEEGKTLRNVGIDNDILILACVPEELESAYALNLTIGLHNSSQLNALNALCDSGKINPDKLSLQLKIDSGMHRLGFDKAQLRDILPKLRAHGYKIDGVYSHLRDDGASQKEYFEQCVALVKEIYPDALVHLASSHSFRDASLRHDAIRLGVIAYGGAMRVYSSVIESRKVVCGEKISYGDYVANRDMNTAVVFGGYADGISRENPSDVLIRNRRCKVVGNVCMDMFVVETGDFLAEVGEEVTLCEPSIMDSVAKQRNTIDYCVMTSWRGRCERCYDAKSGGEETF